jgi:uncharacterized membrane protein YbhN (UPF0104 family)
MRIDAIKFGLATAITTAIVWVLCSILVLAMPSPMMNMSGHMVHANLNGMNWTLTFTGFVLGLISWSIWAGIFGWILAYFYNMLVKE